MPHMYNALIEVNERTPLTDSRIDALMDAISDYHGTVSQHPRGWVTLRITLPAENLTQATRTAITLAEHTTQASALRCDTMLEEEFDLRNGFDAAPELITVSEAARVLNITRQAVLKQINDGKWKTARRVGRDWTLALSELDTRSS
jgi:excisionase family DNA binding protein